MGSSPARPDHPHPGPAGGPRSSSLLAPVAAGLLLFTFALYQGLATNNARDFTIYRLGARLAARGENPYDVERIHRPLAEAYPQTDENTREIIANSGFFLPPLAVLAFLPLAVVSTVAAKAAWAVLSGLAAFFVARLPDLARGAGPPPPSVLPRLLVPFLLVLNPLALSLVLVGQVSLLTAGCVAAGLGCLGRGRPYLAALLWVLPFVKPHVALPLVPLLWYLGGWRPAAVLVALVVGLNLLGATLVGGSPLFLGDYLSALSEAQKTVAYNRVATNPRLTSWNCLLNTAGGPRLELTAVTTAAGYLVWFGLVAGRAALAGVRPSAAWAVAAAAAGSVLCAQVLPYELIVLALLVPWLRDLFDGGSRPRAWPAVGLLAVLLIPGPALHEVGIRFPPSLVVMLLAVLVLTGPVGRRTDRAGKDRTPLGVA